ncbi:hypothetical protein [Cupriavidus sp. CP313]
MEQLLETTRLLAAVKRVAALKPKDRIQDPWCQALMRQPGARRHLAKQDVLPAHIAQVSYVAMVVGSILKLEESMPLPLPVSGHKAGRIRAAAKKLDDEVEGVTALSSTIAQPAFRSALDQLREFSPPQNVPVRTRKGNPERRQFIWAVAENFFRHFKSFHIEAITEIVALRWPETDIRNVRHELTTERQGQIAESAKRQTKVSGEAAIVAAAALTRAQRKEGTAVEDLRTDAQRIGEALATLEGMEDSELAASLAQGLQSVLADFNYQFPEG